MKHLVAGITCFIVSFCGVPTTAIAQETGGSGSYYDLGLKTGSLLPSGIEGVRQLLPTWGIKFGHGVSETMGIEYDIDVANAKGVTYYLGYLSLRWDFTVENAIPLFFLLGADLHYYKRADSYGEITGRLTEYDFQFSSGWHMGFGTETKIYGNLWFRADFRLGFSPGKQLSVNLGGIYRF